LHESKECDKMNESLQKYYNAVKQTLKCKHCGNLFEDPILLRCGCIICRLAIDETAKHDVMRCYPTDV